MTPGLFYAKSDHDLNTKVKNNFSRFPKVIYTPSNNRRFRHNDFWTRMELLKLYSGQIAASKEKSKLGLFGWDSSLDLNIKKVENSPIFPLVTYSASSDKRFRSYGILTIGVAAEFCFLTEQRLNRTELLGLGLTETLEAPNTITVENSLIFPMVCNMDPNGQ
jgi:hypothetical protein